MTLAYLEHPACETTGSLRHVSGAGLPRWWHDLVKVAGPQGAP